MNTSFDFFTLSIFIDCKFEQIIESLKRHPYYLNEIGTDVIEIYKDSLQIERYFNPTPGGHYEKFTWWTNKLYSNKVFLISNLCDGLYSTSKVIREFSHCSLIKIAMSTSTKNEYNCFWFQYIYPDGKERIIYALKEDRWVFYEEGELLPFENPDYYKRRKIKDRINNDIIIEYLSKCGIDLFDIDSNVDQCMTLERTAWNSE